MEKVDMTRIQDYIVYTALRKRVPEKRATQMGIIAHHVLYHLLKIGGNGHVEFRGGQKLNVLRLAEKIGISRQWCSHLCTRLEEAGFLRRIGQEKYGPEQYGPQRIRAGKWLKRKIIGLLKWLDPRNIHRVNSRRHKNHHYSDVKEIIDLIAHLKDRSMEKIRQWEYEERRLSRPGHILGM